MCERMRYAFFWKARGSQRFRLEEFEAKGFSEAVKVARALLEAGGGELGYLVAGVLAAEIKRGQKLVSFLDGEHDSGGN